MDSETAIKTVLLLGRTSEVLHEVKGQLNLPRVQLLAGTSLSDVRRAFTDGTRIHHVLMGAGIDLQTRLDILAEVFARSEHTTVHLKDSASGPAGFLPFVAGVLEGLRAFPEQSRRTP